MSAFLSHLGIYFVRALALLPLPLLRALGAGLGRLLYVLIAKRRQITHVNLRKCFPEFSEKQIEQLAKKHFVVFVQAWLDRGWLWHGSPTITRQRLRFTGDVDLLKEAKPTVFFTPHFVGLDACGVALTQQIGATYGRDWVTIYTNQSNPVFDAWIKARRQRFGHLQLFGRIDGVKGIIAALRAGKGLILLPDMGFGPEESIFVPFYDIPTATVPSLHRFAKLGRARVVTLLNRMTQSGYEIEVISQDWSAFPGQDMTADTALMNNVLQKYINTMPEQYFWVHKRFKDRPLGEASFY